MYYTFKHFRKRQASGTGKRSSISEESETSAAKKVVPHHPRALGGHGRMGKMGRGRLGGKMGRGGGGRKGGGRKGGKGGGGGMSMDAEMDMMMFM